MTTGHNDQMNCLFQKMLSLPMCKNKMVVGEFSADYFTLLFFDAVA
jgi:hypothetical protein